MSCSNPNRVFKIGVKDNGKNDLVFCSSGVDHLEFYSGEWHRQYSSMVSKQAENICRQYIDIPCGRCYSCRLDHSKLWADRCLLEMVYHDHNLFLTLTYDDEHLPKQLSYLDDKYVVLDTLRKKDLQDFIKRLRKYYEQNYNAKIKFFASGEYSPSGRPHYHIIVFGAYLDDLVLHSHSSTGNTFTSETISKLWPYGFSLIAEANYNTAAYTARYVVKKAKEDKTDYIKMANLEPEFISMSRRPGLSYQYFVDNDVFKYDHIIVGTDTGAKKIKPPRYFEKLFEKDNPEEFKRFKEKRTLFAKISSKNRTHDNDLSPQERSRNDDLNIKARTKGLERRKVK